jgi:hybrid cluster-associated redox disulfide protein
MLNKDMTIGELVSKFPQTVEVLFEFGMGCVGCPSAQAETIEEACFVHGFKLDTLMFRLNEQVNK